LSFSASCQAGQPQAISDFSNKGGIFAKIDIDRIAAFCYLLLNFCAWWQGACSFTITILMRLREFILPMSSFMIFVHG
jgi:hypothetical protein